MTDETLNRWFVEKVTDHNTHRRIYEAYAGNVDGLDVNGFDAIRALVFQSAANEIDRRQDAYGESLLVAFNEVTDEWPLKAAAQLAWYETETRDTDDEIYLEEVERFARIENVFDTSFEQTTLEHYYGDNLRETDLTSDERRAVLYLRAFDVDDEREYVEQIESVDDFLQRLRELEAPEEALNAHYFDNSLDSELVAQAAPPDEWPSDMSPETVATDSCILCGTTYNEIYTHDGREWVGRNGGAVEMHRIGENPVYGVDDPGIPSASSRVCSTCMQDDYNTADTVALTVFSDGEARCGAIRHSLVVDMAEFGGEYGRLTEEQAEQIYAIAENNTGYMSLTPVESANSDRSAQLELLQQAFAGEWWPSEYEENEIVIRSRHGSYYLMTRSTAETARAAKETLDTADNRLNA